MASSIREVAELKKEISALREKSITATEKLHDSIAELNTSIASLTELFRTAAEETGTDVELGKKMDTLIKHNEDIARGILLLLELHREHLPQISRHTRMSAEKSGYNTPASRAPRPSAPPPRQPFYQTRGFKMDLSSMEPPPLPPRNEP